MEKKEIIRKSIVERAADIWYRILDPDWFDRSCDDVMTKPMTKEEFDKWFRYCTVQKIIPEKVEFSEAKLEQFIQELKPVFIRRWLDHEHFDRAFRKSEVFWLIMEQIKIWKDKKTEVVEQPLYKKNKRITSQEQIDCIKSMRKCGFTLKAIGESFWVTWERIRQITEE